MQVIFSINKNKIIYDTHNVFYNKSEYSLKSMNLFQQNECQYWVNKKLYN